MSSPTMYSGTDAPGKLDSRRALRVDPTLPYSHSWEDVEMARLGAENAEPWKGNSGLKSTSDYKRRSPWPTTTEVFQGQGHVSNNVAETTSADKSIFILNNGTGSPATLSASVPQIPPQMRRGDTITVVTSSGTETLTVDTIYKNRYFTVNSVPAGTTAAGGVSFAISREVPDYPLWHHPAFYFASGVADTLGGYLYSSYNAVNLRAAALETAASTAGAAVQALSDANIKVTALGYTAGTSISKTMQDKIVAAMGYLADRVDDATALDTILDALVLDLTTELEAQRDAEIARINTYDTVANGFFDSNLTGKVTDVTTRYTKLIADAVSRARLQFQEIVERSAVSAAQVLAATPNKALMEQLELDKTRVALYTELARMSISAYQESVRQLSIGIEYGANQTKRDYANDVALFHGKQEALTWEAQLMQTYSGGTGVGGPGAKTASIISGALGGTLAGAGIGTAITPGIGTAIGAGAGALIGGITGAL